MSPPIALTGVRKLFGQVRALDELDLEIEGGVIGVLGPNGSGKSTLFKLIAGQLRPDAGVVRLWGHDPFVSPEVFADLGLCPEQDAFYEDMRGLDLVAALTRLLDVEQQPPVPSELFSHIASLIDGPIQVGGNATIGRGQTIMRLLEAPL